MTLTTTVKIRNILFATFSHTYQLLLYIVNASDVNIFCSMVQTFQYPCHRSQPPVLSANSLRWSAAHCAKMLSSYDCFIRGKRQKSQGAKSGRMMVDDKTLPSKTLQEPLSCSCIMRPSIVLKKDNT